MSGLHTEVVTAAHEYTRESVPWDLRDEKSDHGRLMHYLAGGGMRAFGRTIAQQKAFRRQCRFLVVSAILFAVWLGFYLV